MKKLNHKTFNKAANRVINKSVGCCLALCIETEWNEKSYEYLKVLNHFFKPVNCVTGYWWGDDFNPKDQLIRAIALDLMAEIVKDL